MKKLLIAIDKLNRFNEVETTCLDIINHFHRLGWQVDLVTRQIEGHFLQRINQLKEQGRLATHFEDEHPLEKEYQLIWICQGYMSHTLIRALEQQEITGVCLFQHYHKYADQDLPYGADVENRLAWRALAVSNSAWAKLVNRGIEEGKLELFPLTVSDAFVQHEAVEVTALRRILLIAEEENEDVLKLKETLARDNITLDFLGTEHTVDKHTPALFAEYQVIMGQFRPIPQALALGIPAFTTDLTYNGGYVADNNLDSHLRRHFLANGDVTVESMEALAEEIKRGFDAARSWTQTFRDAAIEQWSLTARLDALVQQLPTPAPLTITEKQAAALTLHRKVVGDEAEKSRVLEKWLQKRVPSATRIAILKSFAQQNPEQSDIAALIVDNGDADAVEKTQHALQQQYWPASSVQQVPADGLAAALESCTASAVLVVEAGVLLFPHALLSIIEHRLREPSKALWYSDALYGKSSEELSAILKPDFSVDMLRSQPYIGNQVVIDVARARDAGGFDPRYKKLAVQDLLWRLVETVGAQSVGHVSEVVMHIPYSFKDWLTDETVLAEHPPLTQAHVTRCGIQATIEPGMQTGLHRVRYHHPQVPKVSIIIPTRDRQSLLRRCLETLLEKTRWPDYEVVIVDNGSVQPDACEYLDQLVALNLPQIKVLRWPQPFNYSAINNFAAAHSAGDILLYLNNDVEIVASDWIDAMVEQVLRPEVGVVGARLEFEDGRIQHAGIVAGVGLGISSIYEGIAGGTLGYLHRLQSVNNVTAVSAACMMVRKETFQELGGFDDEAFPHYFGDVDLGLKARAAGFMNVWTPYARLVHMGGATRVLGEKINVVAAPGDEHYGQLRKKWGAALRDDPSYNRNLAKVGSNFQLGIRQADMQQPLPGRPLPVIMACNKNFTGCGNYRVIMPFNALEQNVVLEGGLHHGIPSAMEVASAQPDVLLLELVMDAEIKQRVQQYREVSNAKIIFEYDDYFLNLPMKNRFRKVVPKDMPSLLRRGIEQADWLVVSTEPLAEAYAPFHSDIRVAKNRLDVTLWENLQCLRMQGKKPRVGWAGGSSHTGDLEILLPFIKELENDVDWVFMGMKPQGVKCEYHIGVPFDYYPEKLSTLNLDLALVPLENNYFNECKSNLRLLELGALGVPVICTDIEPYRCGLPVTLVANRYKDWMKAIRAHLAEWQSGQLAERGDRLRQAVHTEWMLRDEGLTDWRKAWLP